MRKILSYRNIASFLFIATFFVFVLAQHYTRKNGHEADGWVSVQSIFPKGPVKPVVTEKKNDNKAVTTAE
jgi:hypothetical protein